MELQGAEDVVHGQRADQVIHGALRSRRGHAWTESKTEWRRLAHTYMD